MITVNGPRVELQGDNDTLEAETMCALHVMKEILKELYGEEAARKKDNGRRRLYFKLC